MPKSRNYGSANRGGKIMDSDGLSAKKTWHCFVEDKKNSLKKQTNLRHLNLDNNKISKIQNIKHMRKLDKLSLNGNMIKELSSIDTTEPMVELRELHLEKN